MSAKIATQIMDSVLVFIARGDDDGANEDAFYEVLEKTASGTFHYKDITGTAWGDLDYDIDIEKAKKNIFPQLEN